MTSPPVWLCRTSPRGRSSVKNAERLLPDRASVVRTIRSPDGRFDRTRCRLVYSSWHRKPSPSRFAAPPSESPRRANPPRRAPTTQLSKKHPVGSRAIALASGRLSSGHPIPLLADVDAEIALSPIRDSGKGTALESCPERQPKGAAQTSKNAGLSRLRAAFLAPSGDGPMQDRLLSAII